MIVKYLIPFLISFLISISLCYLGILWGKKIKCLGRSSNRHIHNKNITRLGGIAIVASFVLVVLFNRDLVISSELAGFLCASVLLLAVGFWDDVKEIFWKFQLFFQVVVSLLIFIFGVRIYYITNPITGGIINLDSEMGIIFSAFLVIFWIALIMNAINWIDGVDGVSSGITFIAAITIFFLSLKPEVNQPPVAIISLALSGAILGFLIFNFHPSKILAGTSGAMFMGFSLAILSIFSGTKIATALLVLAIPIIDFLWVIFERLRKKKSIFRPDKNHLHFKLLELGWSQRKIAAVYLGTTLLISFVALNTRAVGKGITLFFAVSIMLLALWFVEKKTAEKNYKK